jgi:uncharacterized protein (TIGR02145 family)
MKKIGILLAIFCTLQANGQPFSISFSGPGLSTVKVQNLTTGVIVDVPAGDVLHLSATTDIQENTDLKSSGLKIYPNPMTDKSTLSILPPISGDAVITICDMTGKVLTKFKDYLNNCAQEFSLSDIKNGLYIINVQGNGYHYSTKILSNGRSNYTGIIARKNTNSQKVVDKKTINDTKGSQNSVDMIYNAGERLKYTAVSGNNSTIMTDIPANDKTVVFTFTECKDGDNNYYPVIQIGTQLWMAENLKTTKYNDNTEIPLVTDNTEWGSLTTPAFCWYNNAPENKNTYGALYNKYIVNLESGANHACPTGWHVPLYSEWMSLKSYLGDPPVTIVGSKLKETGTSHWQSPNTGATNETGFTAIPGGDRSASGPYGNSGKYCFMWSFEGSRFYTQYNDMDLSIGSCQAKSGQSIRCIKDN